MNDDNNQFPFIFMRVASKSKLCPDEDFERTYYFRWWTYRKQLVQTKLWDAEAKFFKTRQRSAYELTTPRNSRDGSVPRLHWRDSEHRGTLEWVQYTFKSFDILLDNYEQDAISKEDYFKTLKIYAQSQRRKLADGREIAHSATLGRVTAPLSE